jgi:hypothetical protein
MVDAGCVGASCVAYPLSIPRDFQQLFRVYPKHPCQSLVGLSPFRSDSVAFPHDERCWANTRTTRQAIARNARLVQ